MPLRRKQKNDISFTMVFVNIHELPGITYNM